MSKAKLEDREFLEFNLLVKNIIFSKMFTEKAKPFAYGAKILIFSHFLVKMGVFVNGHFNS